MPNHYGAVKIHCQSTKKVKYLAAQGNYYLSELTNALLEAQDAVVKMGLNITQGNLRAGDVVDQGDEFRRSPAYIMPIFLELSDKLH